MTIKAAPNMTLAAIITLTITACIDPPPPLDLQDSMSADAGEDRDLASAVDMPGDMPTSSEDTGPPSGSFSVQAKAEFAERMTSTLVVGEIITNEELLTGLNATFDSLDVADDDLEIKDVRFAHAGVLERLGNLPNIEARSQGITKVYLNVEHKPTGQTFEAALDAHVGKLIDKSYSRVHNVDLDLARSDEAKPIFSIQDITIVREAPSEELDVPRVRQRLPVTTWCDAALPNPEEPDASTLFLSARQNHSLGIPASGAVPQIASFSLMGSCDTLPLGDDEIFTRLSVNVGATNSIDSMYEHTCAIDPNKTSIRCWGNNAHGQVDGKTSSPHTHNAQIEPIQGATFTDISAGLHHSCALAERGDENLYACWGDNSAQQLYLAGTNNGRLETRGVQIAAGDTFSCLLDIRGELSCWGDFSTGDLLQKTYEDEYYVQIGAGAGYLCALTNTSRLLCTGTVELDVDQDTPNIDYDPRDIDDLSVGYNQGCVTSRVRDKTWCWQVGSQGTDEPSLESYTFDLQDSNDASGMLTHKVKQLAFGDGFLCYLGQSLNQANTPDKVFCVGDGTNGELGAQLDAPINAQTLAPFIADTMTATTIDPGSNQLPIDISAGKGFACLNTRAGQVRCWGNSRLGVLGNQQVDYIRPTKIEIPPMLTDSNTNQWLRGNGSVSVGAQHTCALFTPASGASGDTNNVLCWGSGLFGQLGRPHIFAQPTPDTTTQPFSPSHINASSRSTCGLAGNELWCWGDNTSHTITPDDPNANKTFTNPTKVAVNVTEAGGFALGDTHSCITSKNPNGPMSCWGAEEWRSAIVSSSDAPTISFDPVGTMKALTNTTNLSNASFTKVTIRNKQTCFIADYDPPSSRAKQSIICWGEGIDRYRECGLSGQCSSIGLRIMGTWDRDDHSVSALALGDDHLCAHDSLNNKVHCWGSNTSGQLGKGQEIQEVRFPGGGSSPFTQTSEVLAIQGTLGSLALGSHHTCAVTKATDIGMGEGTLRCWGLNKDGQTHPYPPASDPNSLPDQIIWQPTELPSPGQGNLSAHRVFTHSSHTCASYIELTANSKALELYCWGSNSHGQITDTAVGVSAPSTLGMTE